MVIKKLNRTLALLLLLLPQLVIAANPTPENLPGGRIIDFQRMAQLQKNGDAVFVDVRNPVNYGRGHIPSAKLIPYSGKSSNSVAFEQKQDRFDLSALPADKQATLVFYSHGITGWKSYKAAMSAISNGYQQVAWYRAGLSDWKNNNGAIVH